MELPTIIPVQDSLCQHEVKRIRVAGFIVKAVCLTGIKNHTFDLQKMKLKDSALYSWRKWP